jgi:hypothetical protein
MSKRKLSQADATEIRRRAAEGAPKDGLASAFGVSRRHIDRILAGETLPELEQPLGEGGVADQLEQFLAGLSLDEAEETLAAAARVLAAKLDSVQASEAATAAAAAPALVREFNSTVEALRRSTRGPSPLDKILARRDERVRRIEDTPFTLPEDWQP